MGEAKQSKQSPTPALFISTSHTAFLKSEIFSVVITSARPGYLVIISAASLYDFLLDYIVWMENYRWFSIGAHYLCERNQSNQKSKHEQPHLI